MKFMKFQIQVQHLLLLIKEFKIGKIFKEKLLHIPEESKYYPQTFASDMKEKRKQTCRVVHIMHFTHTQTKKKKKNIKKNGKWKKRNQEKLKAAF